MPQMSPMWWTTLMVMFIIIFLILMTNMYFNLNNKLTMKVMLLKKNMSWKW
nr:ATP synthase F0 subunit 8 [Mitjaevia shibingensis]